MERTTYRVNAASWREVDFLPEPEDGLLAVDSLRADPRSEFRSVGARAEVLRKPKGSYIARRSVRGWQQQLFPKHQITRGTFTSLKSF